VFHSVRKANCAQSRANPKRPEGQVVDNPSCPRRGGPGPFHRLVHTRKQKKKRKKKTLSLSINLWAASGARVVQKPQHPRHVHRVPRTPERGYNDGEGLRPLRMDSRRKPVADGAMMAKPCAQSPLATPHSLIPKMAHRRHGDERRKQLFAALGSPKKPAVPAGPTDNLLRLAVKPLPRRGGLHRW